jgi:hypothetical protein
VSTLPIQCSEIYNVGQQQTVILLKPMTQQEREDYLARSALFNGGSIGSLPTFIDNGTVWINRNTRQGPKREFNLPQ